MQTKQEAMNTDDDRQCLSLGFEYEYRSAEYEYDINSPAPFRGFSQATRYAGGS